MGENLKQTLQWNINQRKSTRDEDNTDEEFDELLESSGNSELVWFDIKTITCCHLRKWKGDAMKLGL